MTRKSVVLPEPDGPSRASSEPLGTSRLTLSRATKLPNRLETSLTRMLMAGSIRFRLRDIGQRRGFSLQPIFDEQRHQGEERQHRGDRERTGQVVFLKQFFDPQG